MFGKTSFKIWRHRKKCEKKIKLEEDGKFLENKDNASRISMENFIEKRIDKLKEEMGNEIFNDFVKEVEYYGKTLPRNNRRERTHEEGIDSEEES